MSLGIEMTWKKGRIVQDRKIDLDIDYIEVKVFIDGKNCYLNNFFIHSRDLKNIFLIIIIRSRPIILPQTLRTL